MYDENIINDYFNLPISYLKKKEVLDKDIVNDLELIEVHNEDCKPIYHELFNPNDAISKQVCNQWSKYYTDDINFLKDSKNLYKKIEFNNETNNNEKFSNEWFVIMNNNDFLTKYHFVDFKYLQSFNTNAKFLCYLSIYNITSPVIALLSPIIILIIPFIILKLKGIPVNIKEYKRTISEIMGKHAVGNFFKNFNKVGLNKKFYLIFSLAFYCFQMYQNCMSCRKFYKNQKEIHVFFDETKKYIKNTIKNMEHYLTCSNSLSSYNNFNKDVIKNKKILESHYDRLNKLVDIQYNISFYKNINQIGRLMREFHRTRYDESLKSALLFSLGFNGYVSNVCELKKLLKSKNVNFCKFTDNKLKFNDVLYPSLHNSPGVVKNDVIIDKNYIITGPNAAGKTTLIKTVLLNIIFSQQMGLGFYKTASIDPFKYLHCYINIPDTSSRDSLFQAEARRCKNIIENVNSDPECTHFCLFDELYSGTNPDEASASAYAFIDYLTKNNNVKFILTTHFIDVCEKLDSNENIKNLHMETELKNNKLCYNYKITDGISKTKGGLEVLKQMQYPEKLINKAITFK